MIHRSCPHRFIACVVGFSAVAALLVQATPTWAQADPATAPATAPTTAPSRMTTPPGFVRFEAAGRQFITLPADERWVRLAASSIPSQTPTTQVSDIASNLSGKRDLLVAAVLADLPTITPSKVERAVDQIMVPAVSEIQTIRPAMVFVVSPMEHVKEALRNGWAERRFRYMATSDQIEYERTVSLQSGGSSDESAVAAFFSPGETEPKRVNALSRYIADTESQVRDQITGRAASAVLRGFAGLVAVEALKDLPQREDQDWLSIGLTNVLAAKYASLVHGSPITDFVQGMIAAPQDGVFNAAKIDLLHPLSADQLREEMVLPYLEAKRRKSIAVMYVWLDRAGPTKVSPLLDAINRTRPADGPSLAAVVKDTSGVDLTQELAGN